jgi:hypothetical protein
VRHVLSPTTRGALAWRRWAVRFHGRRTVLLRKKEAHCYASPSPATVDSLRRSRVSSMDVDEYTSDCLMEANIAKRMRAPKVASLVAKVVHCSENDVSFSEVDGDGKLIFLCDIDDPIYIFVDTFKKTVSDGVTALPMDVKGLHNRLRLTPSMVKYLKSCSWDAARTNARIDACIAANVRR